MIDVLIRAGCFIAIILLGALLRKAGVFQRSDFHVLSKILMKVALPATIVFSFAGKELDRSLLPLALLGLGCGLLYMGLAWLINRKKGKEALAFDLINLSGYNVGSFTLPFVQTFLGPAGVVTLSLFDIGNAVICLGGSASVAKVIRNGSRFSLRQLLHNLVCSVPLMSHVVMVLLHLVGLSLPTPLVSLAEIISGATAFLAMLAIGIGFRVEANRTQLRRMIRHLAIRYGIAAALALLFWFLLPFSPSVRKVLVILVFSPIGSAAPPYTAELEGDVGLASALNSLSIIISIIVITTLLTVLP